MMREQRERENRGKGERGEQLANAGRLASLEGIFACLLLFAGQVCGPSLVQPARVDEVSGRG